MGKPRNLRPRIHVTRGSERVSIAGQWHILGPVGSKEARAEYGRIIALLAEDPYARVSKPARYLLVTLCKEFAASDDVPVKSIGQYFRAADLLLETHLTTPAAEFGPAALKAWQKSLCEKTDETGRKKYSRNYVMQLVSSVRTMYRWGVETERIPAEVYHGLRAVSRPKPGQARPGRVVRPVSDADVSRTLPKLPRSVAGLVRLQRATGARPSEILGLKPCDVDQSSEVWTFAPTVHKTASKGIDRVIYFGPTAKAILAEFDPGSPDLPYFPIVLARRPRATPLWPSHVREQERKKAERGRRKDGRVYTSRSYRKAIIRACQVAGVDPWNPYQLRHARLSEVRKTAGIEAAQAVGGHSRLSTTEVYAKRVEEHARRAAGESG
jgi:integrase